MTCTVTLLLVALVLSLRLCEGSFSILSQPRATCAGFQGIANSIAELTSEVESKIPTFDPLTRLKLTLERLVSSYSVYQSCDVVTAASGQYRIQEGNTLPTHYLCQMDYLGGGWTVMQRRTSARTNFTRSFAEYRDGFGHPSGDFWLGLTRIHRLTQAAPTELAILLEAFDGTTASVRYTNFRVADQTDHFRLTRLSGFTGTVRDSLSSAGNATFSTFDRDTDSNATVNCAQVWGGGWWMNSCGDSNLNGYYAGATPTAIANTSMVWAGYKGASQSLKSTTMLIRKYRP